MSPVRNSHPGRTPNFFVYAFNRSGVSCRGSMLIEYRKTSSPTRSPRIAWSSESRAVSRGHTSGQEV